MNENVRIVAGASLMAVAVNSFFDMIARIGPGVVNWFYVAISFVVVLVIISQVNKLLQKSEK